MIKKKPTYKELEKRIRELEKEKVERKQMEEALNNKISELSSFIQNIPDMAWIKDTESRFIAVNKAFCEAVGTPEESLIDNTCAVCF
ncbi:PAS domain S-box protein, partial [Gemmatimonadota bacterium]